MSNANPYRTKQWSHGLTQALETLTERLAWTKYMLSLAWTAKLGWPRREGGPAPKPAAPIKLRNCQISAFKDHVKLADTARAAQGGDIAPSEMRPVLVAAGSLEAGRLLVNGLTFLGFETTFTLSLAEAIEISKRAPEDWSLVAVEIDSFGGISEVVDDLLECRGTVLDVPVILVSENCSRYDFSEDRLPLCDAIPGPCW